eukprot:scaffold3334_cov369-Prasinococcus_capsulatus_cf.AAC.17
MSGFGEGGGSGFGRGGWEEPRAGGGWGEPGDRRPGDWDCPNCGAMVFASKSICYKCRCPRYPGDPGGRGFGGGYRDGTRSHSAHSIRARSALWGARRVPRAALRQQAHPASMSGAQSVRWPGTATPGRATGYAPTAVPSSSRPRVHASSVAHPRRCAAPPILFSVVPDPGVGGGYDMGRGGYGGGFGGGPPARPGDWTCSNCQALVFASKSACFKCQMPRPSY